MNATAMSIANPRADVGLITPAGISRTTVRAFRASINLSTYLLKAMAALRAKIIHIKISSNKNQLISDPSAVMPRKKARKAKGKAKTVWANLIRERYDFIA